MNISMEKEEKRRGRDPEPPIPASHARDSTAHGADPGDFRQNLTLIKAKLRTKSSANFTQSQAHFVRTLPIKPPKESPATEASPEKEDASHKKRVTFLPMFDSSVVKNRVDCWHKSSTNLSQKPKMTSRPPSVPIAKQPTNNTMKKENSKQRSTELMDHPDLTKKSLGGTITEKAKERSTDLSEEQAFQRKNLNKTIKQKEKKLETTDSQAFQKKSLNATVKQADKKPLKQSVQFTKASEKKEKALKNSPQSKKASQSLNQEEISMTEIFDAFEGSFLPKLKEVKEQKDVKRSSNLLTFEIELIEGVWMKQEEAAHFFSNQNKLKNLCDKIDKDYEEILNN